MRSRPQRPLTCLWVRSHITGQCVWSSGNGVPHFGYLFSGKKKRNSLVTLNQSLQVTGLFSVAPYLKIIMLYYPSLSCPFHIMTYKQIFEWCRNWLPFRSIWGVHTHSFFVGFMLIFIVMCSVLLILICTFGHCTCIVCRLQFTALLDIVHA